MSKAVAILGYSPADLEGPELCLLMDGQIFGMSFMSLPSARKAAYHLSAFGREIEIFERKSGKVLERVGQKVSGLTTNAKYRYIPGLSLRCYCVQIIDTQYDEVGHGNRRD